ncbi:MAG: flavohemoglobin expression-modulating QEGLA motif protein, partial [Mariniphaga sp.]
QELPETASPLRKHLQQMDLAGLVSQVWSFDSDNRSPANREPLLERKDLKKMECLLLGLQIEPFYRTSQTGKTFPLLERRLYSEFSMAFKKAVFEFVKVQASHGIKTFQSLARRDIMPQVWEIDRQLVEIDSRIKFLMLVSPVNGSRAWKEFKNSGYKKAPVFHYRMIPEDPELMKRALYNIQVEDIDDPTLGFLFREKRAETDKMLSMLIDRESADFFYGSLQLFGGVERQLLNDAMNVLDMHPSHRGGEDENGGYYNAKEFAELAHRELRFLQQQWPQVKDRVEIKDTIDSMMVDKGIFFIPSKSRISKKRAEALIQHEIGTHVVTYYNGMNQPLKLLSSGIPGFEELQEGIAVLAEYLSGGLSAGRLKVLAGRVVAVDSLVNHRDFVTTFELLVQQYHFQPRRAFFIVTRVYRGGGFTKDAIYLRGFLALLKYLKEGNSLEPLLIGKIRQNYLPVVEELISRNILKPVSIKPRYLFEDEALERLSELKNKEVITELINFEI